jgi:hypothetical protein
LHKDVEHDPILVNRSPKIVQFASDPDEDLVQVPLVTRLWSTSPQAVRKALTKLGAPSVNTLIRDDDAPLRREQLNIPQA